MRLWLLSQIAKMFGLLIHVEGLPYGRGVSNRALPTIQR